MAEQAGIGRVPTLDPDNVPELLCEGPANIHWLGQLVTMTFTHVRPDATRLFGAQSAVIPEQVVRARVTMSLPNIIGLRELLDRVVKADITQTPTGGASSNKPH
jgi:hypothetical protein